MISVTYNYYTDVFIGNKLTETNFNRYIRDANSILEFCTNSSYLGITEETASADLVSRISDCLCKLAEMSFRYDSTDNMIKSSESVGKWSVEYNYSSLPKSVYSDYRSTVAMYLSGTNLTTMWV